MNPLTEDLSFQYIFLLTVTPAFLTFHTARQGNLVTSMWVNLLETLRVPGFAAQLQLPSLRALLVPQSPSSSSDDPQVIPLLPPHSRRQLNLSPSPDRAVTGIWGDKRQMTACLLTPQINDLKLKQTKLKQKRKEAIWKDNIIYCLKSLMFTN